MSQTDRRLSPVSVALDGVLSVLAAVWLAGGMSWQGRQILRHGADLRRTMILAGAAAVVAMPALWERSLWLRGAQSVWRWLETPRGRRTALLSGFVLFCALSCLQALALRVPMYDVGLFHQILWGVAHGHGFVSTISGAGNFLLDHLSPSLALLVPAFWLTGSSPLILPVLVSAFLMTGVAAWVWLAERIGEGKSWGPALAAAATLFGLCMDSLWGNRHWGFHENAIAFAALSWAFALLMSGTRRSLLILALFLIAAGSKEILLLDVALALAVWAWIGRSEGRLFRVRRAVLALLLLGAFVWFERLPHPADKNYFDRYYAYLGHDLPGFFRTLALSPARIVDNVGAKELIRYFVTVFLPWLFLPFAALGVARREAWWGFALLPSLASAALATYPPLRSSSYHYVLELWPVLAALTLVVISRLRFPRRWAVAWALLALLAWDHDPWGEWREYWAGAREQASARQVLASLPPEDSVSADELAGTWVAGRMLVTRWAALAPFGGLCPRWIFVHEGAQAEKAREICGSGIVGGRDLQGWTILETSSNMVR